MRNGLGTSTGSAYREIQGRPTSIPPSGTRQDQWSIFSAMVLIIALVAVATPHQHAFSVFNNKLVIVIGPTPPGTGVIALHFDATSAKAVSPTRRKPLFLVASGMR